MVGAGELERYLPFDVSDEFLREAAGELRADYPGIDIHAVVGDFHRHLDRIPRKGRRLIAFLGGTIGNFTPRSAGASTSTSTRPWTPVTTSCSAPTS